MTGNATRPTIGVLAGWQFYWTATPLSYLSPIYRGIRQAAQELDCNLLLGCGMGSSATAADPLRPAWPAPSPDTDFVPIGPWNTDGLIAVNPLHAAARSRYLQEVIAAGHPVVFVGSGEAGPAITADNAGGVQAALQHLVAHGHRHIAFIAGSPEDVEGDSGARLRAFQAAQHAFGLPADPRGIAYGRHTFAGGEGAMCQILASGAPFTALLASNDESALGALQALTAAGRRIPEDVAVIGFDDRPESAAHEPALSSVHFPLFLMGYRAVELLLRQISGAGTPAEQVIIPTYLAPRASCGCGRLHVRDIGAPHLTPSRQAPAAGAAELTTKMTAAMLAETHQLNLEQLHDLCAQLIAAFVRGALEPDQAVFQQTLDALLRQTPSDHDEAFLWQTAVSVLAADLPALFTDWPEQHIRRRAYALLDYARVVVGANLEYQHRRFVVEQRWTADRMGRLTAHLLTALDEQQVYQVLAQHLPDMGIKTAWVAEFAGEGADPLAWNLLHPIIPAGQSGLRFSAYCFPPAALVTADRPWSLALAPLVGPRGQLGYVAFDTAQLDLYGAIVQQLAAALNTAQLYRAATEGRRLAEEANQMKSRFLSTVSHELRTPLNLIVGLSSLLLQEGDASGADLPDATRRDVMRIHANAQHLGSLIGDVLDLASSESGQLRLTCEFVDLGQALRMVAETGRHLAQAKGLAWRTTLPESGPWVWGDGTRLRQVALNLISNAVKFTDRGEISLSLALSGAHVTVAVRDTGIGIPVSEQQTIFDEFRRSERSVIQGYSGLGLGLAISRRLIELQGGVLQVTSTGVAGEGATFAFMLPAISAPDNPADAPAHVADAPVRTFLVVDDDPHTLELHARIVQRHAPANQVLQARSGKEALAILAQTPVDLVLLDLAMPELDGFGVLEAMRAREATRTIPVIVVTGQVLTEAEMARLNLGVATVLSKGLYSLEETLAHLDAALARQHKLSSEAQRLVRRAMAYLHAHYAEPLTRRRIADYVGLDEDYLTYCFRRELGMTPITYLNRYRVNQAKHLLKQTDKSVTTIALEVGFADSGYFSRVFRREVGVSPEAYRHT